jgi:putative peptide zinc metalloprotease protein
MVNVGGRQTDQEKPLAMAAGVSRRRLGAHTILARSDGGLHLALSDHELMLVEDLDGNTGTDELVARFGPDVRQLIGELAAGGFLVGVEAEPEPSVVFSGSGVEFTGFDHFVRFVLKAGGRCAVSWGGAALAACLGALGLAVLVTQGSGGDLSGTGAVVAIWALVIIDLPQAVVHESAHALVIAKHGRRVGRAGFGLYWGGVSFFVDATDALMLPRRARMAQALAGPVADLAIAGSLALVAWGLGPSGAGLICRVLSLVVYLHAVLNLIPLLQLDGYWLLSDALDEPELRRRSLRALTNLGNRRGEAALAAYGAISVLFGLGLAATGVVVWITQLWPVASAALHTSVLGAVGVVVLLAPLVLGAAAQGLHLASRGLSKIDDRSKGGERT